jgi:hypothetical protein
VILATIGTETILLALSTLIGVAGALGVAYAVFRSTSEQRLREVDQSLLNHQNLLLQQVDTELSKCRADLVLEKQRADMYRSDLTQRAAVDHLADTVAKDETTRRIEHEMQAMLLKDIIAQLKGLRGTKEPGAIG